MTYHLTARDAARAALKAHAEGRLGYQRGHTACLYRYPDGAVCAIGAALPDYVVEGRGGYPVESLCGAGRISADMDDMLALMKIQNAHDQLCDSEPDSDAAFLALLAEIAGECP